MEPLVERAGLASDRRTERAAMVVDEITRAGLHTVRVTFADAHGLLRGKAVRADLIADAFRNGVGITSALLTKDTGQHNVYPVWVPGGGLGRSWLTGAGDVCMLPDPATFRMLPWAPGTGWLTSDVVTPDGGPVLLSTRAICARAEHALTDHGLAFVGGLEIEFHLYRLPDAGDVTDPDRFEHTHPGRVYLGEDRYDSIEPYAEMLRSNLTELGLAPRSLEVELGPSQLELTFAPTNGLELADQAVLIRSAVKQIARRNGLHATFMSRPRPTGSFASGWHLHQSLVDATTGDNVFATAAADRTAHESRDGPLSMIGRRYVAGLLAHATESCLLTTPTVTGYKRYRARSLAPDRIAWGTQHRGAMLRVIGSGGDPATRVENRVGDSAANPYLYVASQLLSGLAGITDELEPVPSTESPYEADAGPRLPRTLGGAIEAFDGSDFYRAALGAEFVDFLVTLKRAEWDRFMATVTDWEHTEYADLF